MKVKIQMNNIQEPTHSGLKEMEQKHQKSVLNSKIFIQHSWKEATTEWTTILNYPSYPLTLSSITLRMIDLAKVQSSKSNSNGWKSNSHRLKVEESSSSPTTSILELNMYKSKRKTGKKNFQTSTSLSLNNIMTRSLWRLELMIIFQISDTTQVMIQMQRNSSTTTFWSALALLLSRSKTLDSLPLT